MREQGQYQIPFTEVLQEGEVLQRGTGQYESAAESSLRYPEALLQREVKWVERAIDQYRAEAEYGAHTPRRFFGKKEASPTIDELVDRESMAGGALFQYPSRFWLHPPVATDETGVRDWYFSFVYGKDEYTIRYQSTPDEFHKIYNGREYHFTEGERERLQDAIVAYNHQIATEVYHRPVVKQERQSYVALAA